MLHGNDGTTERRNDGNGETGKSHPALGPLGCLLVYHTNVRELATCLFIQQGCTTLTSQHAMTLPTVDPQ